MNKLKIVNGKTGETSEIELGAGTLFVGRGKWNEICISDSFVSSRHGQITLSDKGYLYRDLFSTNGSFHKRGDRKIPLQKLSPPETILEHDDEILLGEEGSKSRLVFLAHDEEEKPPVEDIANRTILSERSVSEIELISAGLEKHPGVFATFYALIKEFNAAEEPESLLNGLTESILRELEQATHVHIHFRAGWFLFSNKLYTRGRDKSGIWMEGDHHTGLSRTLIGKVVESGSALLFEDAPTQFPGAQSAIAAHIYSGVCVPLWNRSEVRGILQVDNRTGSGVFSQRELDLLTLFGVQLALALESMDLCQRLKEAESRLRQENIHLKSQVKRGSRYDRIIGSSAPMGRIMKLIDKVKSTDVTVLITGESGTGKELIARTVHEQGPRASQMFVAFNCSALPEALIESELFGHCKGSFTGADADKKGLFELAHKGTLFLDEVGNTPLSMQMKLLRVLQDGEVRPVGAQTSKRVDVRIIAATNADLKAMVEEGAFREDLYYRLNVFNLHLPPLRERCEDISLLAEHLLEKITRRLQKDVPGFTENAIKCLSQYRFPGNVRELENEMERAVTLVDSGERIDLIHLSDHISCLDRIDSTKDRGDSEFKIRLSEVERNMLVTTLQANKWNIAQTAREMGMSRHGLRKKLKRLGIERAGVDKREEKEEEV